MAFIRRRASSKGRYSHQVLESFRENGKTKKRTLLCLGPYPTLEAAIQDAQCRHRQDRLAQLLAFQQRHPEFK